MCISYFQFSRYMKKMQVYKLNVYLPLGWNIFDTNLTVGGLFGYSSVNSIVNLNVPSSNGVSCGLKRNIEIQINQIHSWVFSYKKILHNKRIHHTLSCIQTNAWPQKFTQVFLHVQSTLDISKLWGLFFTSSNYPKCNLICTSGNLDL